MTRTVHTRNDTLELGDRPESPQGLLIGGNDILCPSRILQPGVLRANSGIIETSTDGMRLDNLTGGRLQDVRPYTVQHTGLTLRECCAVPISVETYKVRSVSRYK